MLVAPVSQYPALQSTPWPLLEHAPAVGSTRQSIPRAAGHASLMFGPNESTVIVDWDQQGTSFINRDNLLPTPALPVAIRHVTRDTNIDRSIDRLKRLTSNASCVEVKSLRSFLLVLVNFTQISSRVFVVKICRHVSN